ncbi:hypothetical protein A4X13_0g3683 [Tilletia indica]|uniref:Uncharacterized protein n=1 Tax=Tilletia indica TaxID=43049 RepID=A0A177TCB1_9BASI|nr:hypothetical protein A4X13_0g3683 [Tilletia indica]
MLSCSRGIPAPDAQAFHSAFDSEQHRPSGIIRLRIRAFTPTPASSPRNSLACTIIMMGTENDRVKAAIDKLRVKTIFEKLIAISSTRYGTPVERHGPDVQWVDFDYPDWGLPDVSAYGTSSAPWIFMGVDFTEPFRVKHFPLPTTYQRLSRLKDFFSLVRTETKNAKNDWPKHMEQMYNHLDELVRYHTLRRTRRGVEASQGKRSGFTLEDGVRRLNTHTLSTLAPTNANGREMLFFLWDAPLHTYRAPKVKEHETIQCLERYGWTTTTTLIRACDAYRMRPYSRFHVFNPLEWRQYRDSLQNNLAPDMPRRSRPFRKEPIASSANVAPAVDEQVPSVASVAALPDVGHQNSR